MGKVGSSSIYESLSSSLSHKPYHIHTLNPDRIRKQKDRQNSKNLKIENHLFDSEAVIKNYLNQNKHLKIITLIREPISRNIAAYFQNLDIFHKSNDKFKKSHIVNDKTIEHCAFLNVSPKIIAVLNQLSKKEYSNSQDLLSNLSQQKISKALIKKNKLRLLKATNTHNEHINELIKDFTLNYNHGVPLSWFDREYKDVLGIDIFKIKFPRLKGYLQITHELFDCLILKLEIPDKRKETILSEFLKKDYKLKNTNIGNDKFYGEAYKNFKRKIQLPETYVNKMLNSQYTKHFYNPIERQTIKAKWIR